MLTYRRTLSYSSVHVTTRLLSLPIFKTVLRYLYCIFEKYQGFNKIIKSLMKVAASIILRTCQLKVPRPLAEFHPPLHKNLDPPLVVKAKRCFSVCLSNTK